jgi:carboxyl-terminal processing protease
MEEDRKEVVAKNEETSLNNTFIKEELPKGFDMQEKKPIRIQLGMLRNIVIVVVVVMISSWGGWFVGANDIKNVKDLFGAVKQTEESSSTLKQTIDRSQPVNKNVDMTMFWSVWDQLESDYLFKEKIDYQKMIYGAISGMTDALGDPYTAFYPPAENQTTKENLNGSFFGVGIQLGYKMGDQLAVMAPLSGMPAEKAGVRAGDYILHIKDEKKQLDKDIFNVKLNDAVEMIRGEKGTSVTLTLMHDDKNEPYEVTLVREEIIVPSVEVEFGQVVNGQFTKEATGTGKLVAHLKLSRFGELTDQQWDEAVSKIVDKGDSVGGVVLDVRNNPGGYLQGAVNLAAEFIPVGKVVVVQESSKEKTKDFKTSRIGRLQEMPLVVLMNKGSASASEILAGALKEYNRAKLIGETSFGKGTMQSAGDLSQGAGLHITIARWLTPNKNWVHEKGLEPDVAVAFDKEHPSNDVQLTKASEIVLGIK